MKAIIYARVSTYDKQDIETQINIVKGYCERNNIEIVKVYQDKISGMKESREEFNLLLEDMRSGLFECIVVYKLDRMGRSVSHLLKLFEEFNNMNVKFISVTQNFNTTTPEGRLFLRMMMLLAEYERDLTSSRIRAKLDYIKEQIDKKGFYRKQDGTKIFKRGRPTGAKDKGQRKKSGYIRRWVGQRKGRVKKPMLKI